MNVSHFFEKVVVRIQTAANDHVIIHHEHYRHYHHHTTTALHYYVFNFTYMRTLEVDEVSDEEADDEETMLGSTEI